MYNALRRVYRALNTRPPLRHGADLEIDRQLSQRYIEMLPELEQDFGLDLTKWKRVLNARLATPAAQHAGSESRPVLSTYAAEFVAK
jgi:hypothetical protein